MAADLIGVLGQTLPGVATDTTLYTVPAGRVAVLSGIIVCNVGSAATYRVNLRVNGAAVAAGNAACFEIALPVGTTDHVLKGVTLGDNDVITVRSSSGGVTFTVVGEETDVPT